MVYHLDQQLSKGEAAERLLDQHFSDRFHISPATREEQRRGIDRTFQKRTTKRNYFIEYKTDWTAGRTNNAFIETVSVDTMNIPGWIYTSEAEWLLYFVPHKQTIFIARMMTIRAVADQWVVDYGPAKAIPNDGYHTWGVPVPLTELANVSSKIETISVDRDEDTQSWKRSLNNPA